MADQAAMYLFHHVFLPPKLPQSDDFDPNNDRALISFICNALGSFKNHSSGARSVAIQHAEEMMQLMLRIHQPLGDTVAVNEDELAEALRDLVSSGKPVALHIRAQNAGVLVSRAGNAMHVESFELSPKNNAVFSTLGRIRRSFPATATSIKLEQVQQDGFLGTLAVVLSKMSSQHAPDTQPSVRKAGQDHEEIRDTTHPKLVTQLLDSYLLAMGTQIEGNKIWKNTREDVLWNQTLLPWRRSPTWLLIRVALQLVWGRLFTGFGSSADTYKEFMLFFHGEILGHGIQLQLPSEVLLIMTAKISRRLHKLGDIPASFFLAHVRQTMFQANRLLAARWSEIQKHDSPPLNLSRLGSLNFDQDIMLDLPEVDNFVHSIAARARANASKDFIPPWTLVRYNSSALPDAPTTSDREHLALNLAAFELWIKDNLQAWLAGKIQEQDHNTCSQLRRLVEEYHSVACQYYSTDPEATSVMLLTIVELWIACDRMATSIYPMLCDYDPGLPKDILQNLILPCKHHMERLQRVEDYVNQRSKNSRFSTPTIFSDFGSPDCFPVRYFDQSEQHQSLLHRIEDKGRRDREAKIAELRDKKRQYEDLMNQWRLGECWFQTGYNHKTGRSYQFHSNSCSRHGYLRRAEALTIHIHEWPLPPRTLEAKSVVFELSVPLSFGQWREATTFVLYDVLKVEQTKRAEAREKYTLEGYRGLSDFFSRTVSSPSIYLLSEDKPHIVTHYHAKPVGTATEGRVCLDNALHYKYFNGHRNCFFSSFASTEKIPKQCTYEMPRDSAKLQKFLFRPASQPNGPSPNTVIASQFECPNHITLEEYKALCAIPGGYRIQWEGVLLQLFSPSIDFKKMETRLFILQCIYQAGPPNESPLRESHAICDDAVFAKNLLEGLQDATRRFEENWQSSISLSVFIAIGGRLLSLTSYIDVQDECLLYLSMARRATFAWVEAIKTRCQDNQNDKEKVALQRRVLEVALICVETFSVDGVFRKRLFSDNDAASIFIQCSITIHDISQSHLSTLDKPFRHLLSRWQRTCFHSYRVLLETIVIEKGNALDQAICASWSGYQPSGHWRVLSETHDTWLTTQTGTSEEKMSVHFCLVTGELLVQGVPLDHLPPPYIQHPAYATLFGPLSIEIMPTSIPGLQFSSKRQYAGHNVHLGLDQKHGTTDLLVQAVLGGKRLELIPKRCLRERFPYAFVEEYVHWYDHLNDSIEFRPIAAPWNHSVSHWKLTRASTGGKWVMERGDSALIGLKSNTSQVLSGILKRLEDSRYIHVVYRRTKSSLTIDLPRLRLEFALNSGDTAISSRQFRGMSIDEDQSIGTLIGLQDKLVLRRARPKHRLLPPERKVLVSEGRVSFSRKGDHTNVTISKDESLGVQAYSIDERLGRLVGNGSRQSKLFLAYLHALTSFGLPDPLPRNTGTESALSILRSASIMSFDRLSQENIDTLCLLGRLTPARGYYPAHKREMQVVAWSPALSCLAQHGAYYESVQSIFRLAERSKFFHLELYVEPPRLDRVAEDLLERDNIRSSTFRISGFGAEHHTTTKDAVYSARDCETSTQRADAFTLASSIYLGDASLPRSLLVDVDVHLWNFLQKGPPVHGTSGLFEPDTITYDAEYLSGWFDFVKKNWIHLHETLGHGINKFRLMIWLATLAFCKTSDMMVLQVLAQFHTNRQRMSEVSPPPAHIFDLSEGASFKRDKTQRIISTVLVSFAESPEFRLTRRVEEVEVEFERRQDAQFEANKNAAVEQVVSTLQNQWPCRKPNPPQKKGDSDWRNYITWHQISSQIVRSFETWDDNRQFKDYLHQISKRVPFEVTPSVVPPSRLATPTWNLRRQLRYLTDDDIFKRSVNFTIESNGWIPKGGHLQQTVSEPSRLDSLIESLDVTAKAPYEKRYVKNLQLSCKSLTALAATTKGQEIVKADNDDNLVASFYDVCEDKVARIYAVMMNAVFTSEVEENKLHTAIPDIYHRPRISPVFFLRRVNKNNLCNTSKEWKKIIIEYGIAITQLQRAERMLAALHDPVALANEIRNPGHTNWNPHAFPDILLLEVESGIMVREIQEEISRSMRNPPRGANSVMQLNMGEGKSSVIAPAVAATLAGGRMLVRIIVAKPQSKQMLQMLDSKLGDLLDRRIFHLPFSRAVQVGTSEANAIRDICQDCIDSRGIMLVQPEHILSFQLMGIETQISGKTDVSRLLLETKSFLDNNARDIVDESDENFSIKFELVYTMGTQQSIEHSPTRWTCIHHVLDILRKALPEIERDDPKSIEVSRRHNGCFPRTRILRSTAKDVLLDRLARQLSQSGSTGLPMATQTTDTQEAVYKYISNPSLSRLEIEAVERSPVWSASTKNTLLLLRGLISCQILSFVFCQKRWRVDFGLDPNRNPKTRLAVPYRAKDNPTARSEFSHPDVIITLTSLSYYYGGLNDRQLFLSFEHLVRSDQADMEYRVWVGDSDRLPLAFHQLSGVNLEDRSQCIQQIFPCLRYAKGVVDYFLAFIVFPKELKEFPQKLSASGWDIGAKKGHPTTGFSGTCDSQAFLPLDVSHIDLQEQKHTNAMVLSYLLQEENSVELMPPRRSKTASDAEALIDMVIQLKPPARVILDVGAQILELDNVGVARTWLEKMEDHDRTQAVIFCDENDNICVVDRRGRVEAFHTSPFYSQTDVCLVFLDEAHTRGTDLKLPESYRAAVTLGANLTKDRLVQACMRMRKLGKGQSVVFCVPDEIQEKIEDRFGYRGAKPTVSNILQWTISETWIDLQRGIWLWANQGRRHQQHAKIWSRIRENGRPNLMTEEAESFLEDEAQSLDTRYRPTQRSIMEQATSFGQDHITERLVEFGGTNPESATFREEQERELAPETEQEREVQRPAEAKPAVHSIHPDVRSFVSSGTIRSGSEGYTAAFRTFRDTSAAEHFDVTRFPGGLHATNDFIRTIVPLGKGYVSDLFQRPVQWILTSISKSRVIEAALIISPFEAQELLPLVRKSRYVALHLYAPRPNLGFRSLDSLGLYVVPQQTKPRVLPRQLVVQLNVFSGQMYLGSYEEYLELRQFLGFDVPQTITGRDVMISITAPRDVTSLEPGLIQFLRIVMMKIRRNCESIDKTHVGRVLDQRSLLPSDFE